VFHIENGERVMALSGRSIAVVMAAVMAWGMAARAHAANPPPVAPASAEQCARNQAAGTITYISAYGYSASAGQLDVFLAKELGYFDALCLKVEINAAGGNGQLLVASGRAQFTALGSAADVMLAAANSRNLTAVATYGSTSPFSIFANKNVTRLKALEGKRLGYFINITPLALAMLDAAGVDVGKVELIKMTNYDPTVVTRGQVDAIVGYASNQPQTLKALGLAFNEFLPADFGVQGTYNVMEVNSRFLAEHRDTVADFMRATLKALDFCLTEEAQCLDILHRLAVANQQGAAFPREQLQRTWQVESQWVRGSRMGAPGVQTVAGWQGEYAIVQRYGGRKHLPPIREMMDPDLVASLYHDGVLVWPGP